MTEIIFSFQNQTTIIQCKQEDSMKDICIKFANKIMRNVNELIFMYGGEKINLNSKFMEVSSEEDKKSGKMKIIADLKENIKKFEPIISNEIICPKCKENCRFKINDYKITLYGCQNNHEKRNINLDEFYKTQIIDESKIICDNCKENNKQITYDKQFYKCLVCNQNLCPLCKSKHDKNHIVIGYEQKNYICNKHNEIYDSYCDKCKYNLCLLCQNEHAHKDNIIYFKDILPGLDCIKKDMNNFKIHIDTFFKEINKIIDKLNNIKNIVEIYYKIQYNIINNFNFKKRNFQILNNINNIPQYNKSILFDINKVINEVSISKQFINLIEIYDKKNNFNEVSLKYKINKDDEKVKIFGENFVVNNKNNFKIIYQDNIFDLMEYFDLKNKNNDDDILEIYLKQINDINDISFMFHKCSSLISLPELSKLNTNDIIKMNSIFSHCSSLLELPDISNWNTKNISDMNHLFYHCSSLSSLPDISKWDTGNIKYMDNMFSSCSSLISLPDISKWNMENVKKITQMFFHCTSLISLPDISKWNTKNLEEINSLFSSCSSLTSLPDISKWNTEKVTLMNQMFYGCSKLSLLPDISKWNIKNVIDMGYLFFGCSSLKKLPNIYIWDINNVKSIDSMLYKCSSLESIPDFSNWKKNSKLDIDSMFKKIKNKNKNH